jgi:hypothetical protein
MSTHAPSEPIPRITPTRAAMMGLVSVWSIALGVLALWFALDPSSPLVSPIARAAAAITLLCAAQLLFLVCVAERIFLRAPRPLVRRARVSLAVTLTVALGATIATLSAGPTA